MENRVNKIKVYGLLCIVTLHTFATAQPLNYDTTSTVTDQEITQQHDDTTTERTTEFTVQTPWVYIKMLTDDPFVQATLALVIIAGIITVGNHLYRS